MEKQLNQQEYNIVIVGRPNVGKSSIFNFLLGKTEAYIKDEEGTTLDWRSKKIGNIRFWDTPGVFKINLLPPCKIDEIFFVVDNVVLDVDKKLFLSLKAKFNNVFVIVNKVDKGVENYSFFKNYLEISLKARIGLEKLRHYLSNKKINIADVKQEKKIWAIVGRPNVGKSSLVNLLSKRELHRVEDFEGTTKEFLPVDLDDMTLLDTPGQRHRAKFPHYSNVFGVVFITDLREEKHDYKVINMLFKRKKPVFIVLNKIDLAKDDEIRKIEERFHKFFDIKILKVSCLKQSGIAEIEKNIQKIEENYSKRIKTSLLNEWLLNEIKPIEPRIKFITQIDTAFPKFFIDYKLEEHKEKMLKRRLARKFDFLGIPIEIKYKDNK